MIPALKERPVPKQAMVYRCPCCNRKLAVGILTKITVKCPKCKRMVDIHG